LRKVFTIKEFLESNSRIGNWKSVLQSIPLISENDVFKERRLVGL
jgi:hypothetical protein